MSTSYCCTRTHVKEEHPSKNSPSRVNRNRFQSRVGYQLPTADPVCLQALNTDPNPVT